MIATNGKRRARAELVDRLRDELLAGARLAGDQHRRAGRRRLLDDPVHGADAGAVADDPAEASLLAKLAAERSHLAQRVLPLDRFLQEDLQPLRIDRLAQVVVGAFLDRFDGAVDGALRGQKDERDIGQLFLSACSRSAPPIRGITRSDTMMAGRKVVTFRIASSPSAASSV